MGHRLCVTAAAAAAAAAAVVMTKARTVAEKTIIETNHFVLPVCVASSRARAIISRKAFYTDLQRMDTSH